MKLIKRKEYLEKLESVAGTPDIKVITGVRRSGKSKLLETLMEQIRISNHEANIIHINFNLPEYEHLLEYRALYDYVNERYVYGKEKTTYYHLILLRGAKKGV